MNQNINLGTFNFNTDALYTRLAELRSQLQAVNVNVKEMRNEANKTAKELTNTSNKIAEMAANGQDSGEEFENLTKEMEALSKVLISQNVLLEDAESQMRITNQEYKEASNLVRALTTSENELIGAKEKVTQLLEQEITSIASARQSNKDLLAIRNQLNPAIAEELELINQLNSRLDSNNEYIKENASSYEQQKINIGNYSESIKEALGTLDPFNMSLTDFVGKANEAGGVGNLLTGTFKQLITGIRGMISASLAFIATPLGAAITAIVLAGTALYNIFKDFTPILDKVEQATAAVGAAFDVVKNSVIALVTGAKSLKDVFSGLGSEMQNAAQAAADLKKAQQDLEDVMQGQEIQNAKIKGQIEALTIAAKDRTKSEEERLAMLKQAEQLEKENFNQRKAIAAEDLRIATEQIKVKAGITSAELQELRKRHKNEVDFFNAFKEMAESRTSGVEEMFSTFQKSLSGYYNTISEHNKFVEQNVNLTNRVIERAENESNKRREQAERDREQRAQQAEQNRQKAYDNEIRQMQERIDLFRSEQGFHKKSLEEQLEVDRIVAKDSIAILDKELANKKISREKYQAEVNKINADLAAREAEIVIQNAQDELEIWQNTNQELLEQGKYWSDEAVAQEKERLDQQLQLQNQYAETRKANGDITEKELQAIILENTLDTETKKKEIEDAFDLQKRTERMAIRQAEFAQELIELEANGATKWELEQAIRDEQYATDLANLEQRRADELISLEQFEAEKQAIITKYEHETAQASTEIEKIKQEAKVQLASQAFGVMAEIAGKESAAGKAFAVAQATIDTYASAVSAYNSMSGIPIVGPALGAVAAGIAVATGLMNVKKIVSTKTPKMGGFATGGKIEKYHGIPIERQPNGDNRLISVYDGEAVLNPTQQRLIGHDVLAMAGVPGFATGGLVGSQSPIVQSSVFNQINQLELTESISEAVRLGAMEGSAVGSATGSQQGIKDLNTDLETQRRAAF